MPAVYTVADVCGLLGVSDETVRRGAADGWIPAVRVSASKYVFPRQAVDSWLAASEDRAAADVLDRVVEEDTL